MIIILNVMDKLKCAGHLYDNKISTQNNCGFKIINMKKCLLFKKTRKSHKYNRYLQLLIL